MKIERTVTLALDLYGFSFARLFGSFWLMYRLDKWGNSRLNGTVVDFTAIEMPRDGSFVWKKGDGPREDGFFYGKKRPNSDLYDYEVEYTAGPKDVEWFCKTDCNYLECLEREKTLEIEEPAVFALRELDRARRKKIDDIKVWWRSYIFPNGKGYDEKNLGRLLESAEKSLRSNDWSGALKRAAEEAGRKQQKVTPTSVSDQVPPLRVEEKRIELEKSNKQLQDQLQQLKSQFEQQQKFIQQIMDMQQQQRVTPSP